MSPGSTTTLSHLDGSACSVPSARLSSFVERAPGSPPRTPLARLEVHVALLDAVPAPVQAGPARVCDGRVAVDPQRVVRLEVLGRDVLEQRPPRVAVHPVADRPPGDAAVEDLHRVEELALTVPAGI